MTIKILSQRLNEVLNDDYEWSIFFYRRKNSKIGNPYLVFKWDTREGSDLRNIVCDIVSFTTAKYTKNNCFVQDYSPNNNKQAIDHVLTSSDLINSNYNSLIGAIANSESYTLEIGRPDGYILRGVLQESGHTCMFVNVGTPIKNYTHTFFYENVMRRADDKYITLTPFFNVFVDGFDCFLEGTSAHTFFDIESYHKYNKNLVHSSLLEARIVVNMPQDGHPRRDRSVFSDIASLHDNLGKCLDLIIKIKQEKPDDERVRGLVVVDGRIDATTEESYNTMIDLLGARRIHDELYSGEFTPINATFSPQ